jgi:hypothetical protein
MKPTALLRLLVLVLLLVAYSTGQDTHKPLSVASFATTRCFSKGSLGIINPDLYIGVKTDRNELFYGSGGRAPNDWNGKSASETEIVVFYDYQVWTAPKLPEHFDLSKAVIISFEQDRIRFFDFEKMGGCYYMRLKN